MRQKEIMTEKKEGKEDKNEEKNKEDFLFNSE